MVTEYELNSIPHLGRGCCKRRLNIDAKEGNLEKKDPTPTRLRNGV